MRLLSLVIPACVILVLVRGSQGFLDRSVDVTTATPNSEDTEYEDATTDGIVLEEDTTPFPDQEDDPVGVSSLGMNSTTTGTIECQCGIKPKGDISVTDINIEGARRDGRTFLGKWQAAEEPELLIIPNEPAQAREYPWIAAITKRKWDQKNHVICGGSLVNSRFLVTAAHCIKNQPRFRMEVAFYAHNATHEALKVDPLVEIRKIKRFIVHPGWNQENVDNDIGLIELDRPINFNESPVRPICLPVNASHDQFDGRNATVAGWGYTSSGGPNSKVLNKITVPIYSEKQCQEDTIYKDKILPSMICAGYQEGGRDACTNDSGGPLVVEEEDGRHVLVGIVSWGHGCAKPNAPGVYTRVTRYVDWIKQEVVRGESCSS